MCLRCRTRFTPISEEQKCCSIGCADMCGRDWEVTYVRAALDKALFDAYQIQLRNASKDDLVGSSPQGLGKEA